MTIVLFSILPSPFYPLHSTLPILPSPFYPPHSTLSILPSPFYPPHSTLSILPSPFYPPHSTLPILPSPFYPLHSTLSILPSPPHSTPFIPCQGLLCVDYYHIWPHRSTTETRTWRQTQHWVHPMPKENVMKYIFTTSVFLFFVAKWHFQKKTHIVYSHFRIFRIQVWDIVPVSINSSCCPIVPLSTGLVVLLYLWALVLLSYCTSEHWSCCPIVPLSTRLVVLLYLWALVLLY